MVVYIRDNLCIGNQHDAEHPPEDVTAILWTALTPAISLPKGLLVARLPLREYTEPDLIDLQAGVDWLTKHLPHQKILVACRMGLGRSPSVILAYLCCREHLSYEEALAQITAKCQGITPLPRLEPLIQKMCSPKGR